MLCAHTFQSPNSYIVEEQRRDWNRVRCQSSSSILSSTIVADFTRCGEYMVDAGEVGTDRVFFRVVGES